VTSYYGTETVDAVKDFQRRTILTKDGRRGKRRWKRSTLPTRAVSYTKEQRSSREKKKQAALARASSAAGRIE
jgi:peptidoglycan hydrolase-like protein with peptidoglycan-binding domain